LILIIIQELQNKGYIYKGNYKGLYSVSDEEFVVKSSAVEKDGKYYHPVSGHELEERNEETYFLEISKFQKWLEEYIEDNKNFIIPKRNVTELKSNFLKKGVQDLSVSRSNFT